MKNRIPIKDAERISKDRKCPMVIVFGIHDDGERFTITTYGATKKLCKLAGEYGKRLAHAIYEVAELIQVEPEGTPEEPLVLEGRKPLFGFVDKNSLKKFKSEEGLAKMAVFEIFNSPYDEEDVKVEIKQCEG